MRKLLGIVAAMMCSCAAFGQDATTPPANEHVVLTVQGRGVQIYSCTKTPTAAAWVFVAPAARLFDKDGLEVGTHGDGPVWHLQDGSSVVGQVIAKAPSPDAGAVPWLLLKVASRSGAGSMDAVDLVRRSATKGGVAPGGACDVGALTSVPYEATYTFYSSK
ncbi:hypothetical protein HDF16_001162 [Granulicella aggregans]|uniref:DUF3455 domain-containing protein n=1 Tax=Granulicella aggregans TaxID=474949 RepID=A0A7W8E2G1_9BACT|nr:DUF3455 domain-containing protein [Granulicella aggregans]MBB5056477.1 hypothetical protein [Granulicella aggregans]